MKKVSRAALYFLGGILAVLAVLLLAVNLYVQSQRTQARIEEELGRRLGTELRIQRISVTPWWGLKLRGITIPQADASVPRDFLKADTFRLRIRFLSLFARELVIKEVSLINPTVVWAQNSDGKWRIPAALTPAEEMRASDAPAGGASAPAPARADAPREASAFRPIDGSADAPAPFTPEVRRVTLAKGKFHFLDSKGRPLGTFEGLGFCSNFWTST